MGPSSNNALDRSRGLAPARRNAATQAGQNARIMTGVVDPSTASLNQRAKRWWDIPAKVAVGERIANEEKARHVGHHNDARDALRHAEWSRRMADEVGPVFSTVVGVEHELEGLMRFQPLSESVMDMINNGEGVASSVARRPIDRSTLQEAPVSVRGAMRDGQDRYDDALPDRAVYPSRPYGDYGTPKNGYKDGPATRSGTRSYPNY